MINQDTELTQERLKEVLDYNSNTGIFTYKLARQKIRVGDIAGSKRKDGYIRITIDYKLYRAHRLAWLFVYGYLPKYIDHRDRIRDNNWIKNLREITRSQNAINSKTPIDNTSGVKGVHYYKQMRKWQAQIGILGKLTHLGYHENKLDAAKARYKAEIEHGYTDISSEMSDAHLYILRHEALIESDRADKALIESYQEVIDDEIEY